MNTINLNATGSTPSVRFGTDNRLVIKGRSISEYGIFFYQPLINWAGKLKLHELIVDIDLEYVNSLSSKKLLFLLKMLDNNTQVQKMVVNWFYEDGDEDALSKGQIFAESLHHAEFRFHKHKEAI